MTKKAKVLVHPSFQIGNISPRLYGVFLEPIGTMVNGSMFNPKHPTADENGFRHDYIDLLKATDLPAVRLPGGNFISGWDWKDSIGPRNQRKVHLDPAWFQYITNEVGHDEYLRWAELCNMESLYTINLGTGNINDAMSIVEYTNHPRGTHWSDLRREYGRETPYGVKTWYLGNEMDGPWQIASWQKNPKGYGVLANEVSKAMKWVDPTIETVVCASSSPFLDHYPRWESEVLEECYETVDYLSMHHYHSAPPGDYAALLGGSCYFEDYINTEIALCDFIQAKMRSPKKIMLSFDEYGTFPRPLEELHPGRGPHNLAARHYVFDPNRRYVRHDPDNMTIPNRFLESSDMLDALTTASTLLAFMRHADRVKIGCMTGGLRLVVSADREHVWKPAAHYPFTQLMRYGKGVSLQTVVDCDTFDIPGYAIDDTSQYSTRTGINFIDTAAAYDKTSGELNVFIINRNWEDGCELELDASAFREFRFVEHIMMHSEDMSLKNSFENPNALVPQVNTDTGFANGVLTAKLNKLSWNVLRFSCR